MRLAALALTWLSTAVMMAIPVSAVPQSWDIDETQSQLVFTIPDSPDFVMVPSAEFPPFIALILKFRNQTSLDFGPWNDGNAADLDGTVASDYVAGTSIAFTSGTHLIGGLDSGSYRPNPASFNPALVNAQNPNGQYSDATTGTATIGARVRGETITGFETDGSFLSFDDLQFDISSAGPITITGTSFDSTALTVGISAMTMDYDGLVTLAGQPILDQLDTVLPTSGLIGPNTATGGTIAPSAGNPSIPQITIPIDVDVTFDLNGLPIDGTLTGQIVALPEPSLRASLICGAVALFALARGRSRRR